MLIAHLSEVALRSLLSALLVFSLLAASFFLFEPQVGRSATSGPFTVSQTITGEISFSTDAANVAMSGSLNGLTGGTANGTTTAVVNTNSNTGYIMTIHFASNGSEHTMRGQTTGSSNLMDMVGSSTGSTIEPRFTFYTASSAAVFGYTVSASSSNDLDQSFLNNGTNCNALAGSYTSDRCWMEPATTTFQIINRTTSATNGATTSINFRVYVPNNPTPGLIADTYVATATLTATNQ